MERDFRTNISETTEEKLTELMSNDMKTETRERAGRTVKKGRKTKVHVVLLSPRYQDMGTRQNSQPGVLCLE